jgi:hypothetical protein
LGNYLAITSNEDRAMLPSLSISQPVGRPAAEVYAFLVEPANWPQWAAGLGQSLRQDGQDWIAETPQGPVRVRFTARNRFGVLDHRVRLPDGEEIAVPMRVIANGEGSEVLFTLFCQPAMTDAQFSADAEAVRRDLRSLARLLES